MKNFNEVYNLLKTINNSKKITQRELASSLGFSLGKLNYCLLSLKKKGLIKIKNFKKNKNKINYLYLLTPKGIMTKTKMTLIFLERKKKEYDELLKEAQKEKTNK